MKISDEGFVNGARIPTTIEVGFKTIEDIAPIKLKKYMYIEIKSILPDIKTIRVSDFDAEREFGPEASFEVIINGYMIATDDTPDEAEIKSIVVDIIRNICPDMELDFFYIM